MWVLSTDRAELKHFSSPEAITEGYAILSHVWDEPEEEQSFETTQSLSKLCSNTKTNPRDASHAKIRRACRIAQLHGYKWLWVDTSCINKSSSADLSEAINSMYRYYSLAKICYAYLGDVSAGMFLQPSHKGSSNSQLEFLKSKWHTRGWTLQELIAPIFVLFLARDWTPIGTKAELAGLLQEITAVPAKLLRLETRIADYSVAQRMSWAARRETSRLEDRAYSLLGIFGINMSTLYGEGEQAFYRLQEEIIRRSPDTTLFAWSTSNLQRNSLDSEKLPPLPQTEDKYLLAPRPDFFGNCGNILFKPPPPQKIGRPARDMTNSEYSGTITFSDTPYGIRSHIPLIEHWYADEDSGRDEVTAYLFWDQHGSPLGLRLKPSSTSADSFRRHYDVVTDGRRLVRLSRDEQDRFIDPSHPDGRQFVRLTWQEIYITHRPPLESIVSEHANNVFVSMNLGSLVPFRISDTDVDALPTSPLPIELTACTPIPLPWFGNPPVTLQFESRGGSLRYYAILHLGLCSVSETSRAWKHWAVFQFTSRRYIQSTASVPQHDCEHDHINQWPSLTKAFTPPSGRPLEIDRNHDQAIVEETSIILQFEKCPMNPSFTLITHITTRRIKTQSPSSPAMRLPNSLISAPGGMQEVSVQTDGAHLATKGSIMMIHPQSPTQTQSYLSSLDIELHSHHTRHGTLTPESELEDYDTAEGSVQESNDERHLDSNVTVSDGSNDGRGDLRQVDPITTPPEGLQQAILDLDVGKEGEMTGGELSPMKMEIGEGESELAGREEAGRGEQAAQDDEIGTKSNSTEGNEEETGFGGELCAAVGGLMSESHL